MIELKEHNIRPYRELCEMLEKHDKVAYVSATGTGKSYVVGKYIEEHGLVDKTLVLVPSRAISDAWTELLPGLDVMTYHALKEDKELENKIEFIVCDEMHHLGAEQWGAAFFAVTQGFGGTIVGLSATPTRYLDNHRDMAEEIFKGNIVTGLELPEAISEGVLPCFEYITALYDLPSRKPDESMRSRLTENLFHQLDVMSSKYSFQNILKKHLGNGIYKIAVFVSRIDEIPQIKQMVQELYPSAGHYMVHSGMDRKTIDGTFSSFCEDGRLSFIYTVDMLNEGIHIDGVNVVVMFRKTESPTVYLQQLGRALTTSSTSQRVKVFDFVANHSSLKTYVSGSGSIIQWLNDGIGNEKRQIIVSDYTLEELELLDRISAIFHHRWTREEDDILISHYREKHGLDTIMRLLPDRDKEGIKARARILGLGKRTPRYHEEFIDAVREFYLAENGIELIKEKFPYATDQAIRRYALKLGLYKPSTRRRWTEREVKILSENATATMAELQELLPQRSEMSVRGKMGSLGLGESRKYQWTEEEEKILMDNMDKSTPWLQKHLFPNISENTICMHRKELGWMPKTGPGLNEEQICRLCDLYQKGGIGWVRDDPELSFLTDKQISGIVGRRNVRRDGAIHVGWKKEEVEAIEAELKKPKGKRKSPEELHSMFPNHSALAFKRKMGRMKKYYA